MFLTWLTLIDLNSQAPDVPELAHKGILQLSRLSVNCYVKTMKKIIPLFKPYKFFWKYC